MLLPLAILVNGVLVQSFVLYEPYDIVLEESAHFKIDESFDAGLEMMDQDKRKQLQSDYKDNRVRSFYRSTSKKHQKSNTVRHFRSNTRGYLLERHHTQLDSDTASPKPRLSNQLEKNEDESENIEHSYQYDEMLKEYYDESLEDGKSNQTYHAAKKAKSESAVLNSLEELIPLDGLGNISISDNEENEFKEPEVDSKVLVQQYWGFIKIMLIVYVVVAIPLWCMKGWCCWCLFCKVFQPRRTIEEAKIYLARNPPGLVMSESRIHYYEPTNKERECYEDLEHFIRTM